MKTYKISFNSRRRFKWKILFSLNSLRRALQFSLKNVLFPLLHATVMKRFNQRTTQNIHKNDYSLIHYKFLKFLLPRQRTRHVRCQFFRDLYYILMLSACRSYSLYEKKIKNLYGTLRNNSKTSFFFFVFKFSLFRKYS